MKKLDEHCLSNGSVLRLSYSTPASGKEVYDCLASFWPDEAVMECKVRSYSIEELVSMGGPMIEIAKHDNLLATARQLHASKGRKHMALFACFTPTPGGFEYCVFDLNAVRKKLGSMPRKTNQSGSGSDRSDPAWVLDYDTAVLKGKVLTEIKMSDFESVYPPESRDDNYYEVYMKKYAQDYFGSPAHAARQQFLYYRFEAERSEILRRLA